MILEDDVEFIEKFFDKLNEVWIDDFDMLYLNATDGIFMKPKQFNENLMKVEECYGTFGYILNSRFFDEVLVWLKSESKPVDRIYSMFIKFFKVYKVKKPLVFHRGGMSDIQGVIPKNYKHLQKRGTKK
jgi:hypothetical protein